jgi:hypothetical protein
MQKVYLLLRNNQQTGPHSLDELMQLDLQPFDLIWVEGKSYGWSYPSEIDTLKPFVPAVTTAQKVETAAKQPEPEPASITKPVQTSHKKIFVSLPVASTFNPAVSSLPAADTIEQKAEALRQRIQSYSPQAHPEEEIKTNYARSINEVEEDYTSWVFQKKRKKSFISKRNLVIGGIICIGLTGGWLIGKVVFKEPAHKPAQLAVQGSVKKQDLIIPEETRSSAPVLVAEEEPLQHEKKALKQLPASHTAKKVQKKTEVASAGKSTDDFKTPVPETVQKPMSREPVENTPPVTEEKSAPVVTEAPKEKKRTLKELFGGLFKKHQKEETTQAEPKASGNNNNERTATHRDESPVETTTVDLADQVDVKLNKSTDDWMMGVQGLKLTLYNRSAATLKTAAVEVRYYSEENSLLEKKTVYFSNIASKKSQTLAAPDHRLADHVEYKILSAVGTEDAYAKQ